MIDHLKHMASVRPLGPDRNAAKWALAEIERLRAGIRQLGEMDDTCTRGILGEICGYCRCPDGRAAEQSARDKP